MAIDTKFVAKKMEVEGRRMLVTPLVRPQKNLWTQDDEAEEGENWIEQSQIQIDLTYKLMWNIPLWQFILTS